jgi:hypothetical protein
MAGGVCESARRGAIKTARLNPVRKAINLDGADFNAFMRMLFYGASSDGVF